MITDLGVKYICDAAVSVALFAMIAFFVIVFLRRP